MLDLTPIVEAIIGLAATAITVFLIPWLREKFGHEKLEKAKTDYEKAVASYKTAKKAYEDSLSAEELAYIKAEEAMYAAESEVAKAETQIKSDDVEMYYKDGSKVQITLMDEDNNILSNK